MRSPQPRSGAQTRLHSAYLGRGATSRLPPPTRPEGGPGRGPPSPHGGSNNRDTGGSTSRATMEVDMAEEEKAGPSAGDKRGTTDPAGAAPGGGSGHYELPW